MFEISMCQTSTYIIRTGLLLSFSIPENLIKTNYNNNNNDMCVKKNVRILLYYLIAAFATVG